MIARMQAQMPDGPPREPHPDLPPDAPALLVRLTTGGVAWKRTGKPWRGGARDVGAACRAAEDEGLRPPYRIQYVTSARVDHGKAP